MLGLAWVAVSGPALAVPALALVALVYYSHQLAAAIAGDLGVRYPGLAFVIVVNSLVVLTVQLLLAMEGSA